ALAPAKAPASRVPPLDRSQAIRPSSGARRPDQASAPAWALVSAPAVVWVWTWAVVAKVETRVPAPEQGGTWSCPAPRPHQLGPLRFHLDSPLHLAGRWDPSVSSGY